MFSAEPPATPCDDFSREPPIPEDFARPLSVFAADVVDLSLFLPRTPTEFYRALSAMETPPPLRHA